MTHTVTLNYNCEHGKHEQCKGFSRGFKSDPVTLICKCRCHRDGTTNAVQLPSGLAARVTLETVRDN